VAKAKAKKPKTRRVLVRAEWVEELPVEELPEPGGSLRIAGRELAVWNVGPPGRHERPMCDIRVRAAEHSSLAGWQLASLEAAKRGFGPAAPRNAQAPPEQPASWGVSVRLVAHLSDGRRLEPVTRDERELTVDKALDALVEVTEEAVSQWSGGTFGVTGRVALTADRRELLRAEIARAGGGPADVVGVIDAMEAITVAAERLYSGEDVVTGSDEPAGRADEPDAGGDGDDLDLWESVPDEAAEFHYQAEFEDGVDSLDTVEELRLDQTIEYADILCVVHSIGPPDEEGVRTITLRRLHPDPNR
jgi:hypothetical protein